MSPSRQAADIRPPRTASGKRAVASRAPSTGAPTPPAAAGTLEHLQARCGYRFGDAEILAQALTHRSWRGDGGRNGKAASGDNERMEFLGDAVLELRASERLLALFPEGSEGELSRMRSWLVSARYLAEVAEHLQLGLCLRLSRAEDALGGRGNQRLLANAMEAVIAAVYLDGGYKAAAGVIDRCLIDTALARLSPGRLHEFAYKSALQEWAHANGRPLPVYRLLSATGPEHGKLFTVSVEIPDILAATAAARSKKAAQQLAARDALEQLGLLPASLAETAPS